MKPGYATTEWWVTLLTGLLPVFTLIFHRDFAGYVPAVAAGMAGLAGIVYTISRSVVKKAHVQANAVATLTASLP